MWQKRYPLHEFSAIFIALFISVKKRAIAKGVSRSRKGQCYSLRTAAKSKRLQIHLILESFLGMKNS